ncbi:hypothetical protein HGRIS_007133 [Hohenbuehelia grisea]|uniref:Uncharacterized protein n=1 Tax=Hohenbuehelia grisea TaxID=104357 RepID=A0ABR3JBS6_9AGAR
MRLPNLSDELFKLQVSLSRFTHSVKSSHPCTAGLSYIFDQRSFIARDEFRTTIAKSLQPRLFPMDTFDSVSLMIESSSSFEAAPMPMRLESTFDGAGAPVPVDADRHQDFGGYCVIA